MMTQCHKNDTLLHKVKRHNCSWNGDRPALLMASGPEEHYSQKQLQAYMVQFLCVCRLS